MRDSQLPKKPGGSRHRKMTDQHVQLYWFTMLKGSGVAKGVPMVPRDPSWALFYQLYFFEKKNKGILDSIPKSGPNPIASWFLVGVTLGPQEGREWDPP